jgi:phage repressor protein C with HTH and peptisase S24 domain
MISSGSVTAWKNGTLPRSETLQKLARFFNVTADYLIGNVNQPYFYLDNNRISDEINGYIDDHDTAEKDDDSGKNPFMAYEPPRVGSMLSDEESDLIKKYRSLDDHGKRMVHVILTEESKRLESEPVSISIVYIPISCSVQRASAGTGIYLGPEQFETIFVRETPLTRRASFAVPVSGDSMEPRFCDGDILLVANDSVDVGQIGIFTVDGEGYVKKRGDSELLSLNPKYAPIPLTDASRCHGLVIGKLDPAWIRP